MTTVTINKFNQGIVNDPRLPIEGAFRVVTNFDVLTLPRQLNPYRSSESGDSAPATSKKQNFCIAYRTNEWKLFSLGVVSGSGKAEILMKSLTTGGSADLSDNGWATPSNNQSSVGTTSFNLFVYYKKTGMIYGARAGTNLWKFDPSSSVAFDDSFKSLSYTNIAQGIVTEDDILYIPYDNKIASLDDTTWNATALTLPSEFYVTSICEYLNYLAIFCAPLSGVGNSKLFLWDMESITWNEQIDLGEGNVKVGEEVDGSLVAILLSGNNSARNNTNIIFKYYTPSGVVEFPHTRVIGGSSASLPISKQKINNRLFFQMSVSINGSTREGLWSFGRASATEPFGLVHERTPNNDTALVNGSLTGFFIVGDYVFQSYITNGDYALSKTDDQANFSHTSIAETLINPKMVESDRFKQKQLMACGLLYDSLPVSAQAVLQYKVDGGSYTTVFTETTDSQVVTESQDANGTSFSDGRDYEFRIESTGGAKITGLWYVYKVIPTLIQ